MILRALKLLAVSILLVSTWSGPAKAALFNFSYQFGNGDLVTGMLEGDSWSLTETATVPEPSSLALFAIVLGGLGFMTRRRVAT